MIVNGETFKNNFIFLLAYSLIMWLMRSSKFKKKHIKDMSADFLLRCQNSLWLEKRLNLPFDILILGSKSWFFGYFMIPKMFKISSRYHTDYIL